MVPPQEPRDDAPHRTSMMPSPSPIANTDPHYNRGQEARYTPQANFSGQSTPQLQYTSTPIRLSSVIDPTRASVGTPTDSKRPTLQFAMQDESGVPDDAPESIFTKKQLWDMDLTTVFVTAAHKAGKPFDELIQLTFRCQWEQASIVVSKFAGDDMWKRQKKKLNSLFMSAQAEFPEELEFEVWIFCGDRLTKKSKPKDVEEDN